MEVDPQVLRAFAGQVDGVAAVLSDANPGHVVSTSGDGLRNSATQWAGHGAGEHFTQMATTLADDVAEMGRAVRGAAGTYEVTDDALASSFDGLFG